MNSEPTLEQVAAHFRVPIRSNDSVRVLATGICHTQRGSNGSLSVSRSARGSLVVKCWAGCTDHDGWRDVKRKLAEVVLGSSPAMSSQPTDPPRRRVFSDARWRSQTWARIRQASEPIPHQAEHPARRWARAYAVALTCACFWIPGYALLPTWIQDGGVGAIGVHMSSPGRAPDTVVMIIIDANGAPAGVGKRTFNRDVNPNPGPKLGFVRRDGTDLHICEGLKDALAVAGAAQYARDSVAFASGTGGITSPALPESISKAGFQSVTVWADGDDAGQLAAGIFARNAREVQLPGKVRYIDDDDDPASAARVNSEPDDLVYCVMCDALIPFGNDYCDSHQPPRG